jgi:hypothetical protein
MNEREAIEHAAWSALGVTQVDDKIELVRPWRIRADGLGR